MEESLKNKKILKFLCSHGGKIMPRPPDGKLKYIGGETRVIAVPRNIFFSELKKKLNALCNAEMVLKYQVIPEDFDILVSVTCDEDLNHMFNEYDRCDSSNCGTPRLRAFLFPPNPVIHADIQSSASSNIDPLEIEQRYIDAINGIPNSIKRSSSNANRSIFSISSCGSSPRSNAPSEYGHSFEQDVFMPNANGYLNSFDKEIHKVNSSPSLYNLANQYQQYPYHPSPVQQPPVYHTSKVPQGLYKGGPERLVSALSIGRSDLGKCPMGHLPTPVHYYAQSRPQRVYNGGNVEW